MGSQTPFDRLVRAVDAWAQRSGQGAQVLAQIGSGDHVPTSAAWVRSLAPDEFRQRCRSAQLIIAHAGMGSVLTALEFGKPLVVLARRAGLRETRNDHQLATAKWLSARPGIWVAQSEDELPDLVDRVLQQAADLPPQPAAAPPALVQALREFIDR